MAIRNLLERFGYRLIPARPPDFREKVFPPLDDKHVADCRLLTSRTELLRRLPKAGIAAEVGVAFGDFSEEILEIVQPTCLYLIDLWEGARYSDGLARVKERFANEIAKGRVRILRGRSVEKLEKLEDGSLDWVYIDTNHDYETTKQELRVSNLKVRAGGRIAGDDYAVGNPNTGFPYGVIGAVHEFCQGEDWQFEYLTIEQHRMPSFCLKKL